MPINLKSNDTDFNFLINYETNSKNKIKVPQKLIKPHSLIEFAREALDQGFIDRFGTLYPPAKYSEIANIRVSKKQLNRSLRIANALFKAVESRRGEIKVIHPENHRNCKTLICIFGQEIEVKLEEIAKKVEPYRQPRARARARARARGEICYYKPTGKLRLKIDAWVDGKQPAVTDDAGCSLECQLNNFMTELYREAFRRCRYQEEAEKRRAEQDRRKIGQKQRDEIEQTRIMELEQQAEAFDKASKIRAFLKSLEASAINKDPKWIKWAYGYADTIDPLKTCSRH